MLIFHIVDSRCENIAYFCNVLILFIIMKSRLVFKVEKKIGQMPDLSYKCVFEREVFIGDDKSAWFINSSVEEIIKALSFLFPDHRVLVVCE